jgi:hypothetical protein
MSNLLNIAMICNICKKEISMRTISQHLKTHNIKFIDCVKHNRNDFPYWKECPICHINLTKGRNCSRKCDTEFRHRQTGKDSVRWGTIISSETKQKISKTQIERFSKIGGV